MTSDARAQRLLDEFNEGAAPAGAIGGFSARHGLAAVLRHIADTEGDPESWDAVPFWRLEQLADALTAPTLLDRAMAGDANAADLLEQCHPTPVPVSERLPEPGTKVLAHYFNDHGKGRTICAIWVPAKSRSDDADFADDDFTEYDEEDDKFYWPEGWYEAIENWDDFSWIKVYEGEVIYWQPLPAWPALPLPVKEVEK